MAIVTTICSARPYDHIAKTIAVYITAPRNAPAGSVELAFANNFEAKPFYRP